MSFIDGLEVRPRRDLLWRSTGQTDGLEGPRASCSLSLLRLLLAREVEFSDLGL